MKIEELNKIRGRMAALAEGRYESSEVEDQQACALWEIVIQLDRIASVLEEAHK